MAATFVKINDFVEQLGLAVHNLNTAELDIALNRSDADGGAGAAVTATDTILADIVQPTGTGYAAADSQNTWSENPAGTGELIGTATVFTAGGTWQSFKNAVLFNQTAAGDNLICYWAYASDLILLTGETFTVKYSSSGTTGIIFTIT